MDAHAGWDYNEQMRRLIDGHHVAIISDRVQLVPKANSDETCRLRVLDDRIGEYNLAYGYRKGFNYTDMIAAIDLKLLELRESGESLVRSRLARFWSSGCNRCPATTPAHAWPFNTMAREFPRLHMQQYKQCTF